MTAPEAGGRWARFRAQLPMRTSLMAVAVVWLLGCIWSFQEQSAFAAAKGFAFPHLLPLVIDGFAVSMAGVSWAASLDARPAIPARLATLVAVAGSSASNGVWAWLRTDHDPVTVALGVAVPIAANLAFEVLLAELRRQVQRRRGLPAPVAVPYPRLVRLLLAPLQTFRTWRVLVLELTELTQSALTMPALPAPSAESCSTESSSTESSSTGSSSTGQETEEDASMGDLLERAQQILAESPEVGRRRLAKELAVTEYAARTLLARLTDEPHGPNEVRDRETTAIAVYTVNGVRHD